MIDYQRLFHTGLLVPDLRGAMARYSAALGVTWAEPVALRDMTLWTPQAGLHPLSIEVTFSIEGPQHIEIQNGTAGTFYDPALHHGIHVGIWVDDVPGEVERLRTQGWQVAAAGAPPADGWGTFVYLTPPDGGMMVEVVCASLQPVFDRWWAGTGSLLG